MKRSVILIYRYIFVIALIGWAAVSSFAQELDCRIVVNHAQIQGSSTQVFETLQSALNEFVNGRRWTQAQYEANERIKCTMNITVKEYSADGRFQCELIVQSVRPVWQSSYQTIVFSFRDPDFSFNYLEYDPLELRDNTIDNNLTAVIAYYVYIIIGLDMDTMAPQGGTPMLRAAENIVTAAQMMNETGWKAFESTRNRHAIITDYLDQTMSPLRQLVYDYHRKGLDELAVNASRARTFITSVLPALTEAKKNKPMSVLPQLFTEIKKEELVNIYSAASQREKEEVYNLLSNLNSSLNSEWNKIKQTR